MIKIGITGSIGSGKSTITAYLKDKGIPVIDADIISREIYSKYPEILTQIIDMFGKEYVVNDNLNRKRMAKLVFSDSSKRVLFENIILKYIKLEIKKQFEVLERSGSYICILDAPTLIENNLHVLMDYNILIYCDEKTQVLRVMHRDNISRVEVMKRIKAQLSVEKKLKEVQFSINNSFSKEEAYEAAIKIFDKVGVKI